MGSNYGVSVTSDNFAVILSSTDSIYKELMHSKSVVEKFNENLSTYWEGNGLAEVQNNINTVITKLNEFQQTYERFGESLRVLGGNYNSLETEINNSMLC